MINIKQHTLYSVHVLIKKEATTWDMIRTFFDTLKCKLSKKY